jgi:uncharacterized DUF497 family protein
MKRLRPYPASPEIEEKLQWKHRIEWVEVEEVFANDPVIIRGKQDQYGEVRFYAYGQTDAGRYLMIAFVPMEDWQAKVITGRDMIDHERRRFKRRK